MDFKYYLYQNIKNDSQEIFYIGLGTKIKKYKGYKKEYQRAFAKSNRNRFWKNVTSKTDYIVEILMESDDYETIKKVEVELIALYGRRDLGKGTLVNLTDGGDGVKNVKEESKRRIGKLILNIYTGIFYQSIKEAAVSYNIKPTKLENALKGVCINRTPFIYAESENNGIYPIIQDQPIDLKGKHSEEAKFNMRGARLDHRGANCVNSKKVINKMTGELFDSRKELAEKFGYSYGYYGHMLNPKGTRRNTTPFEYYDEEKHKHLLKND